MKIYKHHLRRGLKPWPPWISPMTVLTCEQAAAFLGVERRTLWRWRVAGIGPKPLPVQETQWRVTWYHGHELVRWRAAQLGEPIPTLDELMKQHIDFMDQVGMPPLLRSRSLSPRPCQVVEQWRPKGMRKCKRRRSEKSRQYVEARQRGRSSRSVTEASASAERAGRP